MVNNTWILLIVGIFVMIVVSIWWVINKSPSTNPGNNPATYASVKERVNSSMEQDGKL